jgi:putative ABC transport system permease protein
MPEVDIWATVPVDLPLTLNRQSTWYRAIGRLKPDTTPQQAQADLQAIQANLGKQYPKPDADLRVEVGPLKEETVGGIRKSLWLLMAAVSLLLLITFTNVASLLLARSAERAREVAIRLTLGASRTAVAAQLVSETSLLALLGSALALVLAWAIQSGLRAFAVGIPRLPELSVDWHLAGYTLACGLLATLACGILPALGVTKRSLSLEASASRGQVSGSARLQWTLVGAQVCVAVTLLTGAGLLLRTFQELGRVSPGFDASHVLTFQVSGSWAETANYPALTARINRTLAALRDFPGVRNAASSQTLPGMDDPQEVEVHVTEQDERERKATAQIRFVSHGYFATVAIPILAGEACRESLVFDTVVVNRSFADAYLQANRTLGYHVVPANSGFLPPGRIIGVAADARESGLDKLPSRQSIGAGAHRRRAPTT